MSNDYIIEVTDEEVDEVYNIAATNTSHDGYTRFPGSTYEEGVTNTIEWLLGEADAPPMPPEGGY